MRPPVLAIGLHVLVNFAAMSAPPSCQLDAEQAAWIQSSVSIVVGSRDARFRPALMRGVGCRVLADCRRIMVLMSAGSSRRVLDNLRNNGQIAVVFTQPSTNRALQLKGRDAVVGNAGTADSALAERYLQGFAEEIAGLGFAANVAHNMLANDGDLAAVEFSIDAAYQQTPGPQAGQALGR